ncbi:MAG TPA: DNA-3-methyladenine glycosylase I [Moraxellaceae bacterium]|nr:DNA-3-methyladenine glycosylase I [Moraxellaceae bacterium]
MATPSPVRCPWCGDDPLYVRYHDEEWGVPSRDDRHLFEMLCLEGQQAGLSWITVLRKREAYRRAFHGFDPRKVARMSDADIEVLLSDPGLIRHRGKLTAIRDNAIATLALQREAGSLADWLWGQAGGAPVENRWRSYRDAPAATPLSDRLAKELKKRGFRFVGSTTVYAFLQACGVVNDHEAGCFRHAELKAAADGGPGQSRRRLS